MTQAFRDERRIVVTDLTVSQSEQRMRAQRAEDAARERKAEAQGEECCGGTLCCWSRGGTLKREGFTFAADEAGRVARFIGGAGRVPPPSICYPKCYPCGK